MLVKECSIDDNGYGVVYLAKQTRWVESNDPIDDDDVKYLTDEDKALEYAKSINLNIGFTPVVEKLLFNFKEMDEEDEIDFSQFVDWADVWSGSEHEGEDIEGAVIVEWSWEKHPGYARNILRLGVGGLYPFQSLKTEADLITGNEESTFRSNFSVLLTKEEVTMQNEDQNLEVAIFEELNRGHWKWNWFKNNPQSGFVADQIDEIVKELT